MADATEAVIGMVPMMVAVGVVKKTSDTFFGKAKGKKIPRPSERKIALRRR